MGRTTRILGNMVLGWQKYWGFIKTPLEPQPPALNGKRLINLFYFFSRKPEIRRRHKAVHLLRVSETHDGAGHFLAPQDPGNGGHSCAVAVLGAYFSQQVLQSKVVG